MANRTSQWISTRFMAALAGVFLLFGCEAKEQIRSYKVAKPAETASTAASHRPTSDSAASQSDDSGDAPDRMLVAILPAGDRATFFKVVGPAATIEAKKGEIDDFFASLKAGGDGRPIWKVPSGWKEDGGTGMRMATIWVPADGKPLEMSVTPLPWGGTQAELLSNVNRWREQQLRLPPIGPQQLKNDVSQIKAGETTITVVDLSGQYTGGGMMAPFAGGRDGAANRLPRSGAELPSGHPPVDSSATTPRNAPSAASPAMGAGVPKFEAPKSWRPLPATEFRKAQFAIGDADDDTVVTLTDFSTNAGPLMTDPLANVNRWRGEVGLAKIEEDQLDESTESIEIDGKPAKYVRLVPDTSKPEESKIEKATLAAMVTDGDKIWFIKLFGKRDTVIAEEENFKTFLKSMQFAAGSGAPNGDN